MVNFMVMVNCLNCNVKFEVRQADLNRGWGKFHNKSCKAFYQAKHVTTSNKPPSKRTNIKIVKKLTPEMLAYYRDLENERMYLAAMDDCEMGWDAHKDY